MRFLRKTNQSGFTLLELLGSVVILWLVIGSVYLLLNQGITSYKLDEKRIDEQRNARGGLMRMVQEARDCYRIESVSDNLLYCYGPVRVQETLTTTDNQIYFSTHQYWLSLAPATIYVNGSISTSGTINYVAGTATFTTAETRTVQADYTYAAYVRYYLSGTNLMKREDLYNGYDYPAGAPQIIARSVVNSQVSPVEPVFTRNETVAPYLINVTLLVDRGLSENPPAYRMQSKIRMRK